VSNEVKRDILPVPDRPYSGLVRMEFPYDGGGLGKGGTISLYVDGGKVGDGRIAPEERLRIALAGQ
jgi:hypothetical protein